MTKMVFASEFETSRRTPRGKQAASGTGFSRRANSGARGLDILSRYSPDCRIVFACIFPDVPWAHVTAVFGVGMGHFNQQPYPPRPEDGEPRGVSVIAGSSCLRDCRWSAVCGIAAVLSISRRQARMAS